MKKNSKILGNEIIINSQKMVTSKKKKVSKKVLDKIEPKSKMLDAMKAEKLKQKKPKN